MALATPGSGTLAPSTQNPGFIRNRGSLKHWSATELKYRASLAPGGGPR
jgi:hypothetical protein